MVAVASCMALHGVPVYHVPVYC